ncbi:MAG: hypothetical protein ACRYGI_03135, partial [Janthinobacterium lividum]
RRHMAVMAVMIVAIIAVGVLPQPIIDLAAPSLDHLVPSTRTIASARPIILSQASSQETLP